MHGVKRRVKTSAEKEAERAAAEAARVAKYKAAWADLCAARRALRQRCPPPARGSAAAGATAASASSASESDSANAASSAAPAAAPAAAPLAADAAEVAAVLAAAGRVLELNSENYTAWNARREALAAVERGAAQGERRPPPLPSAEEQAELVAATAVALHEGRDGPLPQRRGDNDGGADGDGDGDEAEAAAARAAFVELLRGELKVAERGIAMNPKSYWAWLHRQWVTVRLFVDPEEWRGELKLCERLLAMDERNFHCWGYRAWVRESAEEYGGVPKTLFDMAEDRFTTKKIEDNFSNYSAWHTKSTLLHGTSAMRFKSPPGMLSQETLALELETVRNAFFTEPSDSAAWFFHGWLMAEARKLGPELEADFCSSEIEEIAELIEEEPDARWALMTTANLRQRLAQLRPDDADEHMPEVKDILSKLQVLDPMRAQRYKDLYGKTA